MTSKKRPARSGASARAESIDAAGEAAPQGWRNAAEEALRGLIEKGEPFIADAVWDRLEAACVTPPPEPRALGAIIIAARKAGQIRSVGFAQSPRRGGIGTLWCAAQTAIRYGAHPVTAAPAPAPVPPVTEEQPEDISFIADAGKLVTRDPQHVFRLLRCEVKELTGAYFRAGSDASVQKHARRGAALLRLVARTPRQP